MTQVKLFHAKTPNLEVFEKQINDFLNDNKDKITVKDIKYTTEIPNPANSVWVNWTALVIYEVI